ncbi:MAG: YeeE/YedE thiosulfate transporter family protein [Bacteroidota bacterium]|nr:YeeE/YedE thiosulfate transporter family protein [Bacteroidota bacterium]
MENQKSQYLNPYFAGFLLGLVLLASIYITGRGLGASGALKSVVVSVVETVTPQHAETAQFYTHYTETHSNHPMKSWLVFEVFGVLVGGFLSGLVSNRLKFKTEHSPQITSKKRIIYAIIGGALFGFGAQLARGCTSGAALSGMAVLSTGGFITMMAIFGSGYIVAYFFRKLWI